MTLATFLIILFAAVLHASWNAVVKGGSDKSMTTVLVAGSGALIAAVLLPILPAPARPSWPFIMASTVFQIVYFVLIAMTYRVADMSQAYPLMRGTAPLLVGVMSAAVGTQLTRSAWAGILVICLGIVSMAAGRRPGQARGIWLALSNAMIIAGYTLIDGAGVRRSNAPAAYTLWIYLLTGTPLAVGMLATRWRPFRRYAAIHWRLGMLGGFGAVMSYGLALWAMTMAPVAVVAALRETSILFGAAIAGFILKERLGPPRIAGACIIAVGAVILRLS